MQRLHSCPKSLSATPRLTTKLTESYKHVSTSETSIGAVYSCIVASKSAVVSIPVETLTIHKA